MILNKLKALSIHLLLSAVVISALISLMLIYWFPSTLLGATNFKDISVMMITIDLVLGPILTFIIYAPQKKGLQLDLSIIAAIQLTGLFYAVYTLYLTHPVYITYHENSFNIITAKQARPDKAKDTSFQISKLSSPKLTFLNIPDEKTKQKLFDEMFDGGVEVEARADYYEPYIDHLDEILEKSISSKMIFLDENIDEASQKFLDNHNDIKQYAFVPLTNGSSSNIIVINKKSGDFISMIKTDPWRFAKK